MPAGWRFCGRTFTAEELELMRDVAEDYAGLAITEMARTICELLQWKRTNGRLKDQECRQLLEDLRDRKWLRLRRCGTRGRVGHGRSNLAKPVRRKPKWREPRESSSP